MKGVLAVGWPNKVEPDIKLQKNTHARIPKHSSREEAAVSK